MYCQFCELAEAGGCYPTTINEDGLLVHATTEGEEPCMKDDDNMPHASDCAHWVQEPCDCAMGKYEL